MYLVLFAYFFNFVNIIFAYQWNNNFLSAGRIGVAVDLGGKCRSGSPIRCYVYGIGIYSWVAAMMTFIIMSKIRLKTKRLEFKPSSNFDFAPFAGVSLRRRQ